MLENINFPIQEKKQFMDLIDHEQQTEENELTYKLALEQNTEAEKLRKVESAFISPSIMINAAFMNMIKLFCMSEVNLEENYHERFHNLWKRFNDF